MKINPASLYKIYEARQAATRKSSVKQEAPGRADSLNISEDAKQMYDFTMQVQTAAKVISEIPDVRQQKIAEVKAKLEQGFYDNKEIYREVAKRLF